MNNTLVSIAKKTLSSGLFSMGESAALKSFLVELTISHHHRNGLRAIRRRRLHRPSKLNLGCGPHKKQGFLNIDLFPPADVTLDLRRGLPFESNCCELIFSEHCFEHFDYPEPISHIFREALRVLKPDGVLSFTVPGTEWPLLDYHEGPDAPYFQACQKHKWHPTEYVTRMEHINYHFRQGTEHRFAYDFETAKKALLAAGFTQIECRNFNPALDSEHRRVGSLCVSARKPALNNQRPAQVAVGTALNSRDWSKK